ncbi:hypothetical protein, partial [Burkholderia metallica]|uniref:hypothetical protein n=1 Tax=Burkholderia metallica TaxID=488729 RepID=UPI001F5B9EEA
MAARWRRRRESGRAARFRAASGLPESCPDVLPAKPPGPLVLIFRRSVPGGHSDHSKYIPDVQSVRHVFPHDRARI